MKKSEVEKFIKKTLKELNEKAEVEFMCGCRVEGDFGTYSEGFGITIEGDETDAYVLKSKIEDKVEGTKFEELSISYGSQTASSDLNNDLGDESYNYSHIVMMLINKRFEK